MCTRARYVHTHVQARLPYLGDLRLNSEQSCRASLKFEVQYSSTEAPVLPKAFCEETRTDPPRLQGSRGPEGEHEANQHDRISAPFGFIRSFQLCISTQTLGRKPSIKQVGAEFVAAILPRELLGSEILFSLCPWLLLLSFMCSLQVP